jgi:polysaccharide export outer membrane protein
LVNLIDLSRKTARQAESYIRDLYAKDFLVQPQVNLTVLEYAPRRVYVAGAVGAPGVVLFQQEQGLTLIEAISKANSFNRLADKKRVTLKRTLPDGTSETKTINVEELMKGDSSETWPLQPGDVINVPERVL